ncbi:Immunoglobulin like [Marasmius crinis-equi]|uniref:Immunoglobulin like n=1 Tax=Marasmius crinis-equi TaxID=585013 RepID=A0ABR3EU30_9AGAR
MSRPDDFCLPPKVRDKMQTFKPHQLRYFTPRHTYLIEDLRKALPNPPFDSHNMMNVHEDTDIMWLCSYCRLLADGSRLNLIVEEPFSILQVATGEERFRSREVIAFLNKFQAEVKPRGGKDTNLGTGWMWNHTQPIWCKIVEDYEAQAYNILRGHDSAANHVACLAAEPHPLPTGDYLITMPYYGKDLHNLAVNPLTRWALAGSVILDLARQLCTAVEFLHSRDMYHLDIKPENIAVKVAQGRRDLTLIDLGWTMSAIYPCSFRGPTGTYHYAPPEVREWYEWDKEVEELDHTKAPPPSPPGYDPREVDAWGIGVVIEFLLDEVLEDEDADVEEYDALDNFAEWMTRRHRSQTS